MASTTGDGARTLGAFVLGRRIAVGGMAEVFEARRADGSGPPFVVKVLLPQYARDAEIVETLRHEAEIAGRLAHDAIVRVVAFGTDDGETWLAMERVDGGTLADLVAHARERGERVSLGAALHVGLELLAALAHVHEAKSETGTPLGIVHRDVTPENVLVSRAGDVKLGDFGIARSAKRGGRTRTGVIKGKLAYLAPEQATGSALDARTDLYAAGVVIWELVTGRRWLEGASEIELLRRAEDPQFRAPSEITDGPPELDAVLERALRRFPEERFASATAMRDALARVAAHAGAGREQLAALALSAFGPSTGTFVSNAPRGRAIDEAGQLRRRSGARASMVGGAVVLVALAAAVAIAIWSEPLEPARDASEGSAEAGAASVSASGERAVRDHADPGSRQAGADHPDGVRAGATAGPGTTTTGVRDDGRASGEPSNAIRASGPTRTTDSDRRAVSRRAGRVSDAPARVSTADAGLVGVDPRAAPLRARRDALAASLHTRHITRADLPAPLPTRLAELDRAIDASHWEDAARLLEELEPTVAAVRVDAAFVRRKLDRVGARIAAARRRGADTRELEDLAAAALQGFLDGRLDETNRRLDEIASRLP